MRLSRTLATVALATGVGAWCSMSPTTAAADTPRVDEPAGYRSPPYRAPVPDTLHGAEVLDTATAEAIWRAGGAIFVDALPAPRRPDNLPEGTLWRAKPRKDIPGSIWLVNTGYDRLSTDMSAYFAGALADATDGDQTVPLVFYCLAECWMSWNAAKRALEIGYANVKWYPGGTDEWAAAGLPLEPRQPLELND